jgi:hypothetical protein
VGGVFGFWYYRFYFFNTMILFPSISNSTASVSSKRFNTSAMLLKRLNEPQTFLFLILDPNEY